MNEIINLGYSHEEFEDFCEEQKPNATIDDWDIEEL